MGYSYVFLGDLRFPSAAKKAAWRSSALDGARFQSPQGWGYEEGDATPADALGKCVHGSPSSRARCALSKTRAAR